MNIASNKNSNNNNDITDYAHLYWKKSFKKSKAWGRAKLAREKIECLKLLKKFGESLVPL